MAGLKDFLALGQNINGKWSIIYIYIYIYIYIIYIYIYTYIYIIETTVNRVEPF